MKVLRNGLTSLKTPRKITCTNCGSDLEIVPSDVKITDDQRDGMWIRVECPVCASHCNLGSDTYTEKEIRLIRRGRIR